MEWVLGISAGLLAYVYAGYPVAAWALARWRERPLRPGTFEGGMAVLLAAHDEVATLPRKVGQLLDLARSEPIREIWIGLDGCADGTAQAVRDLLAARGPEAAMVRVFDFAERRGKAAVLNELAAMARQPVLALMDARQRLEPGALAKLLAHFADPQVGAVSGELVYERAGGAAEKGAQSYWGYEKFIRRCESRWWAVPGATGALYALRRELYEPIPPATLVDDVLIPMRAVLRGYRCLFEPGARVFDVPAADHGAEMRRKRRTLAGIWQLLAIEPRLWTPARNPIWFQWISHKFLRLWTPVLAATALLALGGLAREEGGAWRMAFAGAALAVAASAAAYAAGRKSSSRALGLMGAFFGVNWALALAAADALRGRFDPRWKRSSGADGEGQ